MITRDELRSYFTNKGLTYDNIALYDLYVLELICNKHFNAQHMENMENNRPIYWVSVNPAKYFKGQYDECGKMIRAFLTAKGGYFTAREVVSFNGNGRIGFCCEASDKNLQPVAVAFTEWCDWLVERREQT